MMSEFKFKSKKAKESYDNLLGKILIIVLLFVNDTLWGIILK